MRDNRFYIRTEDYLIEDRYLSGRSEDDDRQYVIADNICDYDTAVVISNALRIHHYLPKFDYDEHLKYLQRSYKNYPDIKDSRKTVKSSKKVNKKMI